MGTGTSLVKRNRNIRLINIDKEEVKKQLKYLKEVEVKKDCLTNLYIN